LENNKISQAVILAGGYGTRLRPFTNTKPKAMYEFEGTPFLDYLLYQVRSYGVTEVVLLLGYLPHVIQEFVGDGSRYGLHILYDVTPVEYDTGARIKHASSLLKDNFMLLYCDNYCPIDFENAQKKFFMTDSLIQITAYTNRDNYTKNNLLADESGKVIIYDKTRCKKGLSMVDIGYAFVNKRVLELLPADNVNFEETLYSDLAQNGLLYVFPVEHRYYSVGSWERIRLAQEFFKPKKVVFLDRDGTLNKKASVAQYIISPEKFVWLKGAREALKLLKEQGYILILVTNQPGIARGFLTEEQLKQIHEKMQADLILSGTRIDYIYYCPHGWNDGCFCRKPEPGLFFKAQRDLSLNLSECVLFGDDERDIQAGRKAGCFKSIQVTEEKSLYNQVTAFLAETSV
jgi:D-glycero-D-manno-heptose 1,7-bisphosphate phosphatase